MIFLGSMNGHGKPVTRKGTKSSGLVFEGSCEQGTVHVKLTMGDNGQPSVYISLTQGDRSHTLSGSFDSVFDYLQE